MKIAILTDLFPPSLGGGPISTFHTTKELAKRGYEVHVISARDKEQPGIQRSDFHIHYISGGRNPRASTLVSILGIILYSLNALIEIKRINPDIVHAQSFLRGGLSAFLVKKFLKKPYCIWEGTASIYSSWRFKNIISRLFLGQADAVVALTQDIKERIQEICNRDVFVIPNGIDLEEFAETSDRDTYKLARDSEKIILFVGRLAPNKGITYLIEAMNMIIKTSPKARLLLVGDGEERQSLENLVRKLGLAGCVTFIGGIPNEEVPNYMAAADVLVLPSLSEGFGIVNLEAMACGLPIVATNVGGIPSIVENGENGFLVSPQNSEEIAEKVMLLLENDELRKRISQNNLEKVKNYSWEAAVDRLEKVYLGVVKVA